MSSKDTILADGLDPKAREWLWSRYIARLGINLIVGAERGR
jgi:hypothetical protein